MILERKKLLALVDRWEKKALSAEARFQESGERRHLREKENAEDMADALRMAANAEEDYSRLVVTRGRLASYEATGMTPEQIVALKAERDEAAERPKRTCNTCRHNTGLASEHCRGCIEITTYHKNWESRGPDQLPNPTALEKLSAKNLYITEKSGSGGGRVWYLHEGPTLESSKNVVRLTPETIDFSADGGNSWQRALKMEGDMLIGKLVQNEGMTLYVADQPSEDEEVRHDH